MVLVAAGNIFPTTSEPFNKLQLIWVVGKTGRAATAGTATT